MSSAWEDAKAAVLARNSDAHMGECEHCKPYVEEVVRHEIEGREQARREYNAAVANGLIGQARTIARRLT